MNTLRIGARINDLGELTQVSPDHYEIYVHLKEHSHPNLPNSPVLAQVETTDNDFEVDVPTIGEFTGSTTARIELFKTLNSECCFASAVFTIGEEIVPPTDAQLIDACNTSKTTSGIGGTEKFYWINNTGNYSNIHWEWDTNQFPDRFRVLLNNQVYLDTFCAGPMQNTCNPPGDCGYTPDKTYGMITVPVNGLITFEVIGDCSGSGGTVWGLKTQCNPFGTAPVIYDGSPKACTVEITEHTILGQTIYLKKWTGAISGQYEFGIQPENTANATTVNWRQDNTEGEVGAGMYFHGLANNTDYRLWIRDKNNTDCISSKTVTVGVTAQTPARFVWWGMGGKSGDVWLPKNYSTSKTYAVMYV